MISSESKLIKLLEASVPILNGMYMKDVACISRRNSSIHYLKRCKIRVKSMKTTLLVHYETQLIVGIHLTVTRKHDTKIILPLVKKHADRVDSILADRGYDDNFVRRCLGSNGIECLIPYRRTGALKDHVNDHFDWNSYHKRSIVESVNSSIKRKYGSFVFSRNWRNQKKEVLIMCLLYNLERQIDMEILSYLSRVATEPKPRKGLSLYKNFKC